MLSAVMKLCLFILNCLIFESSVDLGMFNRGSSTSLPLAALKSARSESGSLSNAREPERFDS